MKLDKHKVANQVFDSEKMLLSETSSFVVQEAFKTLRTNVLFSLPGKGCKYIGVTSANRSEGKSVISTNLAIAFAQLGKRVILIDCDLRLPTIASKIGISNRPGLSDYLTGNEDMEGSLIQRLDKYGIDVMASGNRPPDPTTLLSSEQMKEMLKMLEGYYDYVILDFPPVYLVTDAVLLADKVDGYLVVVRQESSEYSKINETIRQMEFANGKIIGFVYNGSQQEGKIGKGNKYYKYYKYYK